VVSTFLCTDEYVFRLVPRARIAALSFEAGDRHPVVSTIADKVGGIAQIRPSTETILNLHPDLVVMYENTMPRVHANLVALGVPVLDVPWANSVADIRKTTLVLGEKLGARKEAAALLAQMDAKLAAVRAAAAHPAVRTLLYEPNGYATTGGVTEELMNVAGLVDAAPGLYPTRSGTIPVESVIAAAPELLIFSGQRGDADSHATLVPHWPRWRGGPIPPGRACWRFPVPGHGRRMPRKPSPIWAERPVRLRRPGPATRTIADATDKGTRFNPRLPPQL
jgi:iron complex transport system substrate-binding protein